MIYIDPPFDVGADFSMDIIFENEWQSFRTKNDRSLELTSVFQECNPERRKLAVKVGTSSATTL